MPLIAITECHKIEDYKHAIANANAESRIVGHSMNVEDALDGVHGLLLSGGSDVDPAAYGEQPHEKIGRIDIERDRFELALTKAARERRLPIFGICRGVQLMNVAFGGTLVQDIPSDVTGALPHNFPTPAHPSYQVAHEVWLETDSLLARLMKESLIDGDTLIVNSRHHQAIKDVAPGFRAVAEAPDGVIEAIEDPSLPFCLGVQWHPENFWHTGEFRALFEGFVQAASEVRV